MNLFKLLTYTLLVSLFILFSCTKKDDVTPDNTQTEEEKEQEENTENEEEEKEEKEEEEIVNEPPVASEDAISLEIEESKALDVLANDSDPESDAISVKSVSALSGFTFTVEPDNSVTIVSDAGKSVGNYETTYTITDTEGNEATGTIKITLKEKPVTYENYIKFGSSNYTPGTGGWIQAGISGYHEAWIRQGAGGSNFNYKEVVVHISTQFDYRDVGKTYTLTTVSDSYDVPEGKAYVHFEDSKSIADRDTYEVSAGQTITLTNISNNSTGIKAYIIGENLNTSGGTLSFKAVR